MIHQLTYLIIKEDLDFFFLNAYIACIIILTIFVTVALAKKFFKTKINKSYLRI